MIEPTSERAGPTIRRTRYRVLCADPPWSFGDSLPGGGRGASKHYGCLDVHSIARFPLPPMHDDSVLIMWRVASMVDEALTVVRAWGFKPKSELVWVKTKTGQPYAPRMGMGRQVRNCHEVAIIATRGKGAERLSKSEPSVIFAPRGVHSAKPAEAYALIERLYRGPYCELFARQERDGWTTYGDALGGGRASPGELPDLSAAGGGK